MALIRRSVIKVVFLLLAISGFLFVLSLNRQLLGLLLMTSKQYLPTELPNDTTQLFEYDGYIKADPVYIFVQGGPNWELFDKKKSPLLLLPQSGSSLKVYPYQSQIINSTVLSANPALTESQAHHEVEVSAEILYKTISYFKSRNRKVSVLCVSHGSQVGLELLRNWPNIADKLVLGVMRLDIEQEAIEIIKNGKIPYYVNGRNLTSTYLLPGILSQSSSLSRKISNMSMLFGVSRNRYSELLEETDLSNVIYVYGNNDEKIGYPTQDELDFLNKKGASIMEFDGGHDDLGTVKSMKQISNLMLNTN